MISRCWKGVVVALVLLVAIPVESKSAEVKLGLPLQQQRDAFFESLTNSTELQAAGIQIIATHYLNDKEVLDATTEGSIDVGLFALSAFDQVRFDGLRLYTTFTRPFFFRNGADLFAIQDTALGDAVLSDLRRAQLFPLRFWNRGLSQIVARQPISSVQDFYRLKVVDRKSDATNTSALESLGAETTFDSEVSVSSTLSFGPVKKAAVLDPEEREGLAGVRGQLYSTEFEPIVGILAASESYWKQLSERQKQAWKHALEDAAARSRDQIRTSELTARQQLKIQSVQLTSGKRREIIAIMSKALDGSKIHKDLLTVEEARAQVSVGEQKKKN